MRVLPYMLRHGDVLVGGGEQRVVAAVRGDSQARDHCGYVVMFTSGLPLKVDATQTLRVRRTWPTPSGSR
ncbi:hypothetical protein AB0F13_23250 [Streptomyces sp. NPDC026206]|uniref:hypothetical protein n=1 Tax=Streptomyces sp. NPDC026206 TaxID=3157089 RepID=UPI0033FE99FF